MVGLPAVKSTIKIRPDDAEQKIHHSYTDLRNDGSNYRSFIAYDNIRANADLHSSSVRKRRTLKAVTIKSSTPSKYQFYLATLLVYNALISGCVQHNMKYD